MFPRAIRWPGSWAACGTMRWSTSFTPRCTSRRSEQIAMARWPVALKEDHPGHEHRQGRTWHDEGDIITQETYFYVPGLQFSGADCSNGLCDFGFYADVRGGYFYIYPLEAWLTKGTWTCRWSSRVARCAIRDKMAPGKWSFFYNGGWDQPALGGKSSVVAPCMYSITYSTYLQKYVCLFPS